MVLTNQVQLEQNSGIMSIHANVKLYRNLTIPAMQMRKILGMVNVPYYIKRINVTTEAVPGDLENKGYEAIDAYATLKGGSNRVAMAIRNPTRQKFTLKKGTTKAMVLVANVVPPMLALNPSMYSDICEYNR